jgi:hypothetical protein
MEANKMTRLGNLLFWIGCAWFVLTFFWLPPLTIILGSVSIGLLPERIGAVILRAEFALSAAMAAVGLLLRLGANRTLSVVHYVVVVGAASILVLWVFASYGWIRSIN